MTELSPISFEFVLEEAGWAHLLVNVSGDAYRIDRISYLTDALGDLLLAGLMLSFGRSHHIMFDHEGWHTDVTFQGEWIERVVPADDVHADFRCRVEAVEHDRDERKILFSALCESHDQMARALCRAGEKVWSELGAEEYGRRWISSGFPIRELDALKSALGVEPFPSNWE